MARLRHGLREPLLGLSHVSLSHMEVVTESHRGIGLVGIVPLLPVPFLPMPLSYGSLLLSILLTCALLMTPSHPKAAYL